MDCVPVHARSEYHIACRGIRSESGANLGVRVSEELGAESIRDEIFWSPYADLGCSLGYFISVLQALKDNSSDTHW